MSLSTLSSFRQRLSCLIVLACSGATLAQTNYVVTTPNSTTPGLFNTLIGRQAGNSNMTGGGNVFLGSSAGSTNTTGGHNVFLGTGAGYSNTTGDSNAFIGDNAGSSNTTGLNNSFTGSAAGLRNSSGYNNTFMGSVAGSNNTEGSFNTFIGGATGLNNTTGYLNSFFGEAAGLSNTIGYGNVAMGSSAGYSNRNGYENVIVGDSAGYNNTVSNNLFIGSKAGYSTQTGQKSTFIGYQSGSNAVSDSNTFVGYQSGYTTTTGKGNTFFGTASGRGNSTGSHNTFVGNGAGPASNNVDDNVYIGYNTGQRDSGFRNTLLGTNADVMAQNLQNATAIGAGAQVAVSNALVLGNNANVGIGTSAPTARLEVVSEADNASGLRLSKLTASSPSVQATDQFLTVNERGDVVKARYQLRINNAGEWSDKVFSLTYQLRSLGAVEHYIKANNHLSGVPSAEVVAREGIDLVKLNATLLEKIEELTLYSIQLEKADKKHQATSQKQQAEIDELKQLVKQLMNKK